MSKIMRVSCALLAIAGLMSALAACNDSTTNNNPVTPAAAPSAQPGPQPGSAPNWSAVTEYVTSCAYTSCPGAAGFTVRNDGSFYSDADEQPGSVTGAELAELQAAAEAVGAETLTGDLVCENTGPTSGQAEQISLAPESGITPIVIYDDNMGTRTCVRGDIQLAANLKAIMDTLTAEYALSGTSGNPPPNPPHPPVPRPSPSPSPSPSHGPGGPSPRPSAGPHPSPS